MLIVKFGETFLKSKITKKKFINLLIANLKLKGITNIKFKHSYLEIYDDVDINIIANTFGVYKLEVINKYPIKGPILNQVDGEKVLDLILDKIKEKYSSFLKKSTFRITVTRENKKFPFNSLEIQTFLGKHIEKTLDTEAMYKGFDIEIKVRILNDCFWVWSNKDEIKGVGGIPYGIEGKALSLFSGGIDSPVATFLAAKRGIRQDFIFLNIPDSDFLLQQNFQIYEFLKEQYGIVGNFYELRIKKYIQQIKKNIPEGLRQIIFKIFLYKISEKIADKLNLKVLVNGENLGQVSTQTLTNLTLLNQVSNKFIIRPLICFDKIDIINLAKKIGTYDMSIKIKETCAMETHSNSQIKKLEEIFSLYNSLGFDERTVVDDVKLIDNISKINFYKLFTNKIRGDLIDLDVMVADKLNLDKNKEYTFTCFSGYKASQQAYKWSNKGYKVFWTRK